MARLVPPPPPGVADSGANISLTTPAIVRQFHLSTHPWPRPFFITFANNSKFQCTHYADFGPVLGPVAIVDHAPDTLISVSSLTERGFSVRFEAWGQGIGIYVGNQLVYKGHQDLKTKLFHVDLLSLIKPTFDIPAPTPPLSAAPPRRRVWPQAPASLQAISTTAT